MQNPLQSRTNHPWTSAFPLGVLKLCSNRPLPASTITRGKVPANPQKSVRRNSFWHDKLDGPICRPRRWPCGQRLSGLWLFRIIKRKKRPHPESLLSGPAEQPESVANNLPIKMRNPVAESENI